MSSTLRYVEVDQAPGLSRPAIYASDSVVDQVIAKASGTTQTTMIQSSTLRNSIVVASAPKAVAVLTDVTGTTNTSTHRNVTAISTGPGGIGILASAGYAGGNTTVNLVNVIARGGATDIEADTDNSGAVATINATHSSYLTTFKKGPGAAIVDKGGNQAYVPGSDTPFAGDYRLAAGASPIGAGLDEPWNGPLDVDGDPRAIGTTDIGADEFVFPPGALTMGATAVAPKSATLNGSVNPGGAPTTYRFEYGPTIAYGTTTPKKSAGSYPAPVPASATLADLTPAKKYHYRIVATNAGGVTRGADKTFTTAAAP